MLFLDGKNQNLCKKCKTVGKVVKTDVLPTVKAGCRGCGQKIGQKTVGNCSKNSVLPTVEVARQAHRSWSKAKKCGENIEKSLIPHSLDSRLPPWRRK